MFDRCLIYYVMIYDTRGISILGYERNYLGYGRKYERNYLTGIINRGTNF